MFASNPENDVSPIDRAMCVSSQAAHTFQRVITGIQADPDTAPTLDEIEGITDGAVIALAEFAETWKVDINLTDFFIDGFTDMHTLLDYQFRDDGTQELPSELSDETIYGAMGRILIERVGHLDFIALHYSDNGEANRYMYDAIERAIQQRSLSIEQATIYRLGAISMFNLIYHQLRIDDYESTVYEQSRDMPANPVHIALPW